MKLPKTIKSEYSKIVNKPFIYAIIILFIFPFISSAQPFKFNFDKTPVSRALAEAAGKMAVRISFDSGKLELFTISGAISGTEPKDVFLKILENTGYGVEYKYNTYLVVKHLNPVKSKPTEIMVQGVVFDKETGEQLPNATIYFWNKNSSLSTSANGTFGIQIPDSADAFLQVKYLGYHTLDTIINTEKQDDNFRLGLTKKMQTLQTIDVAGEKLEMVAQNEVAGHFTFNPARFADLPNYGETDVFRALQLLPGISSTENSSQLNIRGSSADQNLVLYDGFTLYNLDHFFGVFSALNPYVIKDIQVYRGGFDSRYGERIAGVVDITSKSGNQQKAEFYGGINLISANLTAEIPVSEKFTIVAAGRRAYSDIYSTWLTDALLASKMAQAPPPVLPGKEVTEIQPEFYFSDVNLKLTYNPSQNENISLSLYGAKDYLNSSSISERQRVITNTDDVNKWGNYGFGLSWKKQWNAKSFTNIQAGHSGYFNDYSNNTVLSGDTTQIKLPAQSGTVNYITNETNDLTDYFISVQNKYLLNQSHQFELGAALKFNQFEFYKDASTDIVYNNLKNSSLLYSVYFQDQIAINNLTVKPGFRINYYDKTNKIYFEPRFSASYRTDNSVIYKMAVGRYFQYLNKSTTEQSYGYNRDFWVLADGDLHPVISSNHFIAGASYETKHLFFDLEGYYKTVDGLQEYLFFRNPKGTKSGFAAPKPPTPGLSRFISGTGNAYGIDFLAKYETRNFTSWLAYSLSKATQNFSEINNGDDIPAQFDQTHQLKWTNIYSLKKWNFSTLTLYTTGQPYIESTSKDNNFNTTRVYNRLPDYFRIDLSANYNFNIKNVNIKPGFSILNALNTANYLDIYIRDFDFGNNEFTETTLVKAQELTFNFFVNFRF